MRSLRTFRLVIERYIEVAGPDALVMADGVPKKGVPRVTASDFQRLVEQYGELVEAAKVALRLLDIAPVVGKEAYVEPLRTAIAKVEGVTDGTSSGDSDGGEVREDVRR